MKVLLIRMDRIGDLVCTLPMDQHPLIQRKTTKVHWLITKELESVIECSIPKRTFFSSSLKFTFSNLFRLIQKLKSENFDCVVLFYAPWWVAFACHLAGIPLRFSPRSRWFQILFFNYTLKQKRSLSIKHESEYNWELIQWSLKKLVAVDSVDSETTNSDDINPMSKVPTLTLKSDSPLPVNLPREYIVIHPGMGGSALNWPAHLYFELIQKLISLGKEVVITGTSSDDVWLSPLKKKLHSTPGIHWKDGQLNIKTLIAVLSNSTSVVAPSTGVLHLAASTNVKTIGIYSPIRVQNPIRWGPRGEKTKTLMPQVLCPAEKKCYLNKCQFYPCLEQITCDRVLNEITNKEVNEAIESHSD